MSSGGMRGTEFAAGSSPRGRRLLPGRAQATAGIHCLYGSAPTTGGPFRYPVSANGIGATLDWSTEMHSAVVTVCLLIVGTYAPATGVCPQPQQASRQVPTGPPSRQVRIDLDQQGMRRFDVPHDSISEAAKGAVSRKRPQPFGSSRGPATNAQPQQPDNRQLPGPVGLLLALALLNDSGSTPPAISQAQTN